MHSESRLPYVIVSDPSQNAEPLPRRQPLARRESLPPDEPTSWFGDPKPESGDPPTEPGVRAQLDAFAQPGVLPRRDQAAPPPAAPLPVRSQPLPQRSDPLPQRSDPLPQRGQPLPRRTMRTRPAGRHRSPHRLTVPSDAPSLVLAVPGAATAATAELAAEIAAAARLSCPGVDVRIGFLTGDTQRLDDALKFPDASPDGELELRAVVVPVLAGPHPALDAALAAATDRTAEPVMLASHLGPHPLLAEALHARLADAGLARAGRARGLSIITGVNGVLVLADRGDEATKAASVTAVLLAARLAVPAAPASLGDPQSVTAALERLREADASRPVIAPCLIGLESPAREIEDIASRLGAPRAPPLGAHPAIGQLVAIRYGAALARLAMAGSAG